MATLIAASDANVERNTFDSWNEIGVHPLHHLAFLTNDLFFIFINSRAVLRGELVRNEDEKVYKNNCKL